MPEEKLPTRRDFLTRTAAASLLGVQSAKGETSSALPSVPFGPRRVTRLISGGNPLYGYSHFNRQYDQHMLEYFTDQRVLEYLLRCQQAGINTWQSSYNEQVARQIPLVRDAGCKLQWICLAAPWDVNKSSDWNPSDILAGMLKCAEVVAKFKPIGIAHHGSATDRLWRAGKLDLIQTFVDKVHDLGFPAGISTHNPVILEALEAKGWSNDFYMASLYYQTRRLEDFEKEIGVRPVGETYLSTDPPRMARAIRQARKPCLVYKVLAAGRRCGSAQEVRAAFEFAFQNIKPVDALIIGMYPRYSDQISENTATVRELGV